jgi:hypothetical protein
MHMVRLCRIKVVEWFDGLMHKSNQNLWNGGEENKCYMTRFILVNYAYSLVKKCL